MFTETIGKGDNDYYYITDSLKNKDGFSSENINTNYVKGEFNNSSMKEESSSIKSEGEITKSFISKSYKDSISIDSEGSFQNLKLPNLSYAR